MADLNKLFPGFESFMDGDIEINNEVTVPESDDTTAESVADEVELVEKPVRFTPLRRTASVFATS